MKKEGNSLEVVYREKEKTPTVGGQYDQRVKLSNLTDLLRGDRLHRNGDPIHHVFELDESYLFTTAYSEFHVDKGEPIYVWRIAN